MHYRRITVQWNLCNPTPEFSDILLHTTNIYGPKVFLLTNIKPECSDILYNQTHFPGPLVCWIGQVLTSCTIWHISLVPWCVGLDRFWHLVQSDTFPWSLGVLDWTGSDILYNLTHFPGPLVCWIGQVLTSCTIWHISLVPWCVGLDRFWHLVQSDTFPWSLGVLDWTGSDILYNLTHFPGPLVCWIGQVLTSCTIWHISLVPWCVGLDRFWHLVQSDTFPWSLGVLDWTGSDILYNQTHFPGPLVCWIGQVPTSCTIGHISLVPWCVGLDRFHCAYSSIGQFRKTVLDVSYF